MTKAHRTTGFESNFPTLKILLNHLSAHEFT